MDTRTVVAHAQLFSVVTYSLATALSEPCHQPLFIVSFHSLLYLAFPTSLRGSASSERISPLYQRPNETFFGQHIQATVRWLSSLQTLRVNFSLRQIQMLPVSGLSLSVY